ncbi:MAG: archaeosortase/exosortase family protein, partial [Bacteroidia bacterium]|nr:archaeosortase/exosortase family protein [Bacteroidia bacterium]
LSQFPGNYQGVWIGYACNALSLFVLFSFFIISFPGNWLKKLWFIPVGILLVHLLNILRVFALVLIAHHHYDFLSFNHTYTFTILVYAFIFGLWMWWVNKYAKT